jgi:hypothetical protein
MKLNRKVTIFGKQISVVALALLATAGLASAGLLTYYGMITGTATVKQSLVISSDGSTWKECTGGSYDACKLTYDLGEMVAGDTVTIEKPFYLKNNLPVNEPWDYVYFAYKYEIPENLYDGLTSFKVSYEASTNVPNTCDKVAEIPLDIFKCDGTTCSAMIPDKLGEGMIQKFCGTTIGLKANTIPDTYTITIDIIPVERIESNVMHFGPNGWAGWSCPIGTVVVGGETIRANNTVKCSVSQELPWKPGASVDGVSYPSTPFGYTYDASKNEQGWIVQNDNDHEDCIIYVYCAK